MRLLSYRSLTGTFCITSKELQPLHMILMIGFILTLPKRTLQLATLTVVTLHVTNRLWMLIDGEVWFWWWMMID